ncbi:MAG TPA: tyrosine phenol-lyase, partial [Thermoanaerobaculia bacterium]|nr:tyrosine phenol-lyase [Thermoanaerobaculia bacterium]
MDLVRLAIPRRLYTQSHMDYVAESVIELFLNRETLNGFRIASAPKVLRHFSATFVPMEERVVAEG